MRIERIICCGEIAEKNAFLMQTYADILGRERYIAASPQACTLCSAVAAAVIAGQAPRGRHADFASGQAAMTGVKDCVYPPNPAHGLIYDRPYGLYGQLHDAFGGVNDSAAFGQGNERFTRDKGDVSLY